MMAGNAFYGCFYRRGRTVTYVDGSGSQRRDPCSVLKATVCMRYRDRACVSVYTVRVYAVALTRLDRLHFPDERILVAIRQ